MNPTPTSAGFDALSILTKALVMYCLMEHQAGSATEISVTLTDTGCSVADNGRGHSAGRVVNGRDYVSVIYNVFDHLEGSSGAVPVQIHAIGLSMVNAMCSHLTVTACRDGSAHTRHYASGQLLKQTDTPAAAGATGNTITAEIRPELLGATQIHGLRAWLDQVAKLHPGLTLTFNGARLGHNQAT